MDHFDLVETFASVEQCYSIFSWLVPLTYNRLVWHNGKHPRGIQFKLTGTGR